MTINGKVLSAEIKTVSISTDNLTNFLKNREFTKRSEDIKKARFWYKKGVFSGRNEKESKYL